MKKLLTLMLLTSSLAFAIDLSQDSGSSLKNDQDSTRTEKKNLDMKKSKSNRESTTTTKSKDKTKANELTKAVQYALKNRIEDLEYEGVEPYVSCSIFDNPRSKQDFGITAYHNGVFYDQYNTALENGAKQSLYLKEFDPIRPYEDNIKIYIHCMSYYGAIIGQTLKTGEFSTEITDPEIKNDFKRIQRDLKRKSCRFDNSQEKIACGRTVVVLDTQNPSVYYNGNGIFTEGQYFGYGSSDKLTSSTSKKIAKDKIDSYETSKSTGVSKDLTNTYKVVTSQDTSFKTNYSPKGYMTGH